MREKAPSPGALVVGSSLLLGVVGLGGCEGEGGFVGDDFEFRDCGNGEVEPDEACDDGEANVAREEDCPPGQRCCVNCDRRVVGGP